jgi:hypothetical protein
MGRGNTTASQNPMKRQHKVILLQEEGYIKAQPPAPPTVPGSSVSVRAGMEAREPRAQTAHEQRRLQERGTQSVVRQGGSHEHGKARQGHEREECKRWSEKVVD